MQKEVAEKGGMKADTCMIETRREGRKE